MPKDVTSRELALVSRRQPRVLRGGRSNRVETTVSVLGFLDALLHRLHVPHRFWWRLCDAHDLSLGVPDTPQNFPRRHGYVRLQHIYAGTSAYPELATCQHCGHTMDYAGPCLLVRGMP